MTYRVEGIRQKTPDTFVEVSPELAKERGIQSGTRVELHFALRPGPRARPGHRPRPGQAALHADEFQRIARESTHQQPHRRRRRTRLRIRKHPVQMHVLPEVGREPRCLASTTASATRRRSQDVEVERKWNRADYSMPGAVSVPTQIGKNEE